MHQHAKYLRQNSFSYKVTARTHAQTQHTCNTQPTKCITPPSALKQSLKASQHSKKVLAECHNRGTLILLPTNTGMVTNNINSPTLSIYNTRHQRMVTERTKWWQNWRVRRQPTTLWTVNDSNCKNMLTATLDASSREKRGSHKDNGNTACFHCSTVETAAGMWDCCVLQTRGLSAV